MRHVSTLLPTQPPTGSTPPNRQPPSSPRSTATTDCPTCKGAGATSIDVPTGHPDFGRVWPCPDPHHNEERLARLAKVSGLDRSELGLRLADFKPTDDLAGEVLAAARAFLADPSPLFYLWGGSGNGKTLLLKALVNEFNQRGQTAIYTKFTRLLWWMRQVFGDDGDRESYVDRYERIKRVPVLTLDEFDKANLTAFAQEFQFDFLDERYESGLRGDGCTVFASNTPPAELPGYLRSRVMDGRCLVVENRGRDLRPYLKTFRTDLKRA